MILTILEPLAWMGEHLLVPLMVVLVGLLTYSMFTDPSNQLAEGACHDPQG